MLVRVQTETAIFVPVWQVHKRTPAAVSQNVQRAIAEQAIEIVRIGFWVTGKVFTIPVAEIREMFSVEIFFHSFSSFLPCTQMSEQNLIFKSGSGHLFCLSYKKTAPMGTASNANMLQTEYYEISTASKCISK